MKKALFIELNYKVRNAAEVAAEIVKLVMMRVEWLYLTIN